VAAIIFNNVDGMVDGALSSSTGVTIPTLGATRVDGLNLQGKFLGNTTTVEFETGYATYDGTSMATPHVSGAVASIWRVCRQCRNDQVIQCLRTTAIDLGPAGYDVLYGHGLIRTRAAYTCLRRSCCA
jgi:subtilisin family serine protease